MVAFEFAVITGLAYTIVGGCMAKMRLAWLSILAVVTVLYIQGADTFLTASGAKVGTAPVTGGRCAARLHFEPLTRARRILH
jgi:hypothetical protein